jgi:hypothetical protein
MKLHLFTKRLEKSRLSWKRKSLQEKKAKEVEAKASLCSEVQLGCNRSSGKAFIKAMKTWYKFSQWKSTKDNRNIGPQTEAILLVFYDIPCFFSRTELKLFLGYKSPQVTSDRNKITNTITVILI